MSRGRWIAACLITLALLVLLGWQAQREYLVKACLDSGGAWTGNVCGPLRMRPILHRDLHRSWRLPGPPESRTGPTDRVPDR
jgi:hypothetical protein